MSADFLFKKDSQSRRLRWDKAQIIFRQTMPSGDTTKYFTMPSNGILAVYGCRSGIQKETQIDFSINGVSLMHFIAHGDCQSGIIPVNKGDVVMALIRNLFSASYFAVYIAFVPYE